MAAVNEVSSGMSKSIRLSVLTADPSVRGRAGSSDASVVRQYADCLLANAHFPPITVFDDGHAFWVADGFYRVEAHVEAGFAKIDAIIQPGSRVEALEYACQANSRQGLRLGAFDLAHCVNRLLSEYEQQGHVPEDAVLAAKLGITVAELSWLKDCPADAIEDRPRNTEEETLLLVRAARAVADVDGDQIQQIGPGVAFDVAHLTGAEITANDGRRYLFGHENRSAKQALDSLPADNYYRLRNTLEPFYWVIRDLSAGDAVASVPLSSRQSLWDALVELKNWVDDACVAWSDQFVDPNQIEEQLADDNTESRSAICVRERVTELEGNHHRRAYDEYLLEEVAKSVTGLLDHVSRGEHVATDNEIRLVILQSVNQLVEALPKSVNVQGCLSIASFVIEEIIRIRETPNSHPGEVAAALTNIAELARAD